MEKQITYIMNSYRSIVVLWNDEECEIHVEENKDPIEFEKMNDLMSYYEKTYLDGAYGCKKVTYTKMLVDVITTVVIDGEPFTNIKQKMIETNESGNFINVDN